MLLLSKVLYGGNRFQWPRSPEEAREITPEQFRRLMDGFAIEGTIKEVFPSLMGPGSKDKKPKVRT